MITRPRTIICDIDGVLLKHRGDGCEQHLSSPIVLDGALQKIKEWDREGCSIILVTGRRESVRAATERQLTNVGIVYDHLIMGVGSGVRVLINDRKADKKDDTAIAICVDRNKGLESVE